MLCEGNAIGTLGSNKLNIPKYILDEMKKLTKTSTQENKMLEIESRNFADMMNERYPTVKTSSNFQNSDISKYICLEA